MSFEILETETNGPSSRGRGRGRRQRGRAHDRRGVQGVEFVCANTDTGAGAVVVAEHPATRQVGLGAGSRPDAGRAAARSTRPHRRPLRGAHMVFIPPAWAAARAPARHRCSRKWQGARRPDRGRGVEAFEFEGPKRMKLAEEGLSDSRTTSTR